MALNTVEVAVLALMIVPNDPPQDSETLLEKPKAVGIVAPPTVIPVDRPGPWMASMSGVRIVLPDCRRPRFSVPNRMSPLDGLPSTVRSGDDS